MLTASRLRILLAPLLFAVSPVVARADGPAPAPRMPWVDLLAAARSGEVGVEAEGTGDGRMRIRVANQTGRRLKVVLPPGLIASVATGQFGGLGGFGGMVVGGGIGGGGFAGFGNRSLTAPPAVGLMMLGQSIMSVAGPTDSWNVSSMAQAMTGQGMVGAGRAGPPIPGLGGFRSVPPTDLPSAILEPGQARPLTTRLVSLGAPGAEPGVALPAAGEKLMLGDVSELGASPRVQEVLRRLARDKAPEAVAQAAVWGAAGMPWDEIARASHGWANPHELTLARDLVGRLGRPSAGDPGRLLVDVSSRDSAAEALADEIREALRGASMLGLAVAPGVPARPDGPSIACRIRAGGTDEEPELAVEVATSDARGVAWSPAGKFTLPVARDARGRVDREAFGDALSEELLKRLVVATVKPGRVAKGKGKETFSIRVENYSPLILNGVSLSGAGSKPGEPPKMLLGIGLSPRRFFVLPASAESVGRFGLKQGVRVMALDLSGL